MPILIPQGISVRPAKDVIKDMQVLLERRRSWRETRRSFLEKYSVLRQELELTVEYAQFHAEVCFRSGGICERAECVSAAEHVHHKVRVALAPHMALDTRYAEHICIEHHRSVDNLHRRLLKKVG